MMMSVGLTTCAHLSLQLKLVFPVFDKENFVAPKDKAFALIHDRVRDEIAGLASNRAFLAQQRATRPFAMDHKP